MSAALSYAPGRTLTTVAVNPFSVHGQTGLSGGVCVRLSHSNRGRENAAIKIIWQKIQEPVVGPALKAGRGSLVEVWGWCEGLGKALRTRTSILCDQLDPEGDVGAVLGREESRRYLSSRCALWRVPDSTHTGRSGLTSAWLSLWSAGAATNLPSVCRRRLRALPCRRGGFHPGW